MKEIRVKFNVMYYMPYIPKRCRKTRYAEVTEDITFKVKSITSDEAPIAFVLSDYHYYVTEETPIIRCYKKKLYKQYKVQGRFLNGHDDNDSKRYPQGIDWLVERCIHPYLTHDCEQRNKNYVVNTYKAEISRYILIDNEIWERCGEPRYEICTFGLGHNHGGTGLFVEMYYNPNISKDFYFSALDGDKAVAKANEVAQRRGDTEDVGTFKKMIEVVMPEMVKCKPMKEHGKGDKFINTLNTITENATSVGEAGMLCMLSALVR